MSDGEIENVRVVVRVRPLSKREIELGCQKVTTVDHEHQQITIKKPTAQADVTKSYTFDYILPEECTQTDVYCQTTRPVVDKVLQGYNGTILAYGQTGTGKTFTMTGTGEQRGIIPNTFAHIFSHVGNAKEELTFLVHVTYLEIYNENVRDLLLAKSNKKALNLEVREHSEFGVFVENLSGYIVNTLEELERLMDIGDKNRAVGATDLNFASSRSHTIFTITIESNDKRVEGGKFTRGKLHLVDLAGSERQSKTHASGIRLKEATKINQSLSVLGNVISALVDGKSNHIPYRNSKLTRLLQDSLGGNSKTVMITTISPSESDYEETISTLRYANRAKNIQNHTHMNEQPKDTLLRSFQTEIEELRKQLENATINTQTDTTPEPEHDTPSKKKDRTKKASKKKTNPEVQSENEISDEINVEEASEEIVKARQENSKLREKLQQIQDKILVGGENLLEKAQHQEFLLKVAQSKIDDSIKRQEELKQYLKQCEEERILMEERYSSTQEEVASKTKKLKKLGSLISAAKTELVDLQQEQQREMEVVLDTVRGLTRELQLAELIINAYIPVQYQTMIEKHIRWNEDVGEYHLKCVAYTGNNMRKRLDAQMSLEHESPVHHMPYRQYSTTNRKSRRQSNVPRPARVH